MEELRNKEDIVNLINGISHGFKPNIDECALIWEAISFKSAIPKSFWEDEEKGGCGLCGLYKSPKSMVQETYTAIVDEILDRINEQIPTEYGDPLSSDNYYRYFKALHALGIKACDARIIPHPNSPEFMVPYKL